MRVPMGTLIVLALSAAIAGAQAPDAAGGVVGDVALPSDLSPWGMFLSADPLVKAVLIGLTFASVVTWTLWLAKTIELIWARRKARKALRVLGAARRPAATWRNGARRSSHERAGEGTGSGREPKPVQIGARHGTRRPGLVQCRQHGDQHA